MTVNEFVFLIVLLLGFTVLMPLLGRSDIAALRRTPAGKLPAARRKFYFLTNVFEWSVTGFFLAWWLLMGRSAAEIGLHFQVSGLQWLAVAVSLAAAAGFVVYTWRVTDSPKGLAQVREQLGDLVLVSPHTRAELPQFYRVSITAGICEEVLYRGLMMTALAGVIGLWPAVVVSSVLFGLAHAYQGAAGVLRTGLVGLVMALVVVFTGSLPVAMLIHAAIDMVQGRMLQAAVSVPELVDAGAVEAAASA